MKRKPHISFKNCEGKKYRLYLRSPHKKWNADGVCSDPKEKSADRTINVDSKLLPRRQLSVIIEEVLHAHCWDLKEYQVRKYSSNLMRILYKMGWRRKR